MSLHDKAFWAMGFFLVGVVFASSMQNVSSGFLILTSGVALAGLLLYILGKKWFAILLCTVLIGFSYFGWFNARQQAAFTAPLNKQIYFTGLVERVSAAGQSQSVDISLQDEYHGLIHATLRPYPIVQYGDVVQLNGTLQSPDAASAGYFAKEGIASVMKFPKSMDFVAHNQGSRIKAWLFGVRDYVEASFNKTLQPEQATLMTGLVLGKSSGFSKEFTDKLKLTGTTHLVALSGYNISAIINPLLLILGLLINRKYAVWLCVVVVIGFVVMTGAQASEVRAAIMAVIMILAERTSRVHSVRNALAATAVVMVLYNPNILVFDIGFQLSFFALLGIVYLQPAMELYFHVPPKPSILDWRKNIVATTAAQLAVLPIVLTSFGFFSPLAIVTNVLLLSFIPYTMAVGFFIVLASLLSSYLAFLAALPAKLLLGYELGVIDLFASLPFGVQIQNLPVILSLLYYALLIGFIFYVQRREQRRLIALIPHVV